MTLYEVEYKHRVHYDMYDAMIIRADDEEHARSIAAELQGGADDWTATEVTEPAEAGRLLASFNAG